MRKLVSTAGVCTSVTGPSVAPGLGLHRDVAINDADPGRGISSTARQEKNISPDRAQAAQQPQSRRWPVSVLHCQFSGSMQMVSCTSYTLNKTLCLLNGSAVLSLPHTCG